MCCLFEIIPYNKEDFLLDLPTCTQRLKRTSTQYVDKRNKNNFIYNQYFQFVECWRHVVYVCFNQYLFKLNFFKGSWVFISTFTYISNHNDLINQLLRLFV